MFASKVELLDVARLLSETWSPKIVAQVNDQYVKVAKLLGQLVWHQHADEDELFLVLQGRLTIEYADRPDVELGTGEMHVVPRGVMHNPVAQQECLIALIETVTTRHTGEQTVAATRTIAEQLQG